MSCFFCGSDIHFSQFCDKYNSDISRLTAVRSKKVCCKCFKPIRLIKPVISNHDRICSMYQRCYNCYSPDHHTFFCEKPASQLFIPRLDANLLQRFIETFEPVEQFQFAFYPHFGNIILNAIEILNKPIDACSNIEFTPGTTIIYNYHTFAGNGRTFLDKFKFNSIFVTSRIVTLKNMQISADEFLALLSLHTVELSCSFVTMISKVKLSDVLMITRNIEKLELHETNIIIEPSWPKLLLENVKRKIKLLKITINDLDFDIKALSKFVKEKTAVHSQIFLDIEIPCYFEEIRDPVKEKFEACFVKVRNSLYQSRLINVRFIERDEDMSKITHSLGTFTLQFPN